MLLTSSQVYLDSSYGRPTSGSDGPFSEELQFNFLAFLFKPGLTRILLKRLIVFYKR
jgi:hypothetical protein